MANIIVIMFDTPNTHTVVLLLLSIPFYLAVDNYFSCTDVLQSVIVSQHLYCTVVVSYQVDAPGLVSELEVELAHDGHV